MAKRVICRPSTFEQVSTKDRRPGVSNGPTASGPRVGFGPDHASLAEQALTFALLQFITVVSPTSMSAGEATKVKSKSGEPVGVGPPVGAVVGVGAMVGAAVGDTVGAAVGTAVGVGVAVGSAVGVGVEVGAFVGLAVAVTTTVSLVFSPALFWHVSV